MDKKTARDKSLNTASCEDLFEDPVKAMLVTGGAKTKENNFLSQIEIESLVLSWFKPTYQQMDILSIEKLNSLKWVQMSAATGELFVYNSGRKRI